MHTETFATNDLRPFVDALPIIELAKDIVGVSIPLEPIPCDVAEHAMSAMCREALEQ